MKKKKVIIIIGILVVITGIILCIKRCGNSQTKQEKSVMAETKTAEADSVITEASAAAAEDRTESAGLSQNSTAGKTDKTAENDKTDKNDKTNKAEPKNTGNASSAYTAEPQAAESDDNSMEELKAAGNVEKSGEDLFSSNSGTISDQNIQPTNPSAEEILFVSNS